MELVWVWLVGCLLWCGCVAYFLLDVCLRITFCCDLDLIGLFVNCVVCCCLVVLLLVFEV